MTCADPVLRPDPVHLFYFPSKKEQDVDHYSSLHKATFYMICCDISLIRKRGFEIERDP